MRVLYHILPVHKSTNRRHASEANRNWLDCAKLRSGSESPNRRSSYLSVLCPKVNARPLPGEGEVKSSPCRHLPILTEGKRTDSVRLLLEAAQVFASRNTRVLMKRTPPSQRQPRAPKEQQQRARRFGNRTDDNPRLCRKRRMHQMHFASITCNSGFSSEIQNRKL